MLSAASYLRTQVKVHGELLHSYLRYTVAPDAPHLHTSLG
jgi:hypothetical protein